MACVGVAHPLPPPLTANTKVPVMGLQYMKERERRGEEKTLIKDPACQASAFPAPRRGFTASQCGILHTSCS